MGCNCQKEEEREDEIKADEDNHLNKDGKSDVNRDLSLKQIDNDLLYKDPSGPNVLLPIDPKGLPKDEFSRYLFNLINSLRLNPPSYIDTIVKAKNNIKIDKTGVLIYQSSVKVAINSGERAFDLAIEILKNTEPMDKLIYNPNLTIDVPNNENDVRSKSYLSGEIRKKIDMGIEIKSFWKDAVKDPDTCFILTIVDDSGKSAGNKRSDILDKNNKYMGISSIKIGRSFACYIVLS